jgi:hypothetical protein
MTPSNRRREVAGDIRDAVRGVKGPGPQNQFIHLRAPLNARELIVLKAVSGLPEKCRTPKAAATALMLGGIGIPYSSLAAILRRLERKGAIRLGRIRS